MSALLAIQDRIAELIEAAPLFAGKIEVVTQRKGDIQSAIAERLQRLGFGVTVVLGGGERENETPGAYRERTEFTISVVENPTLNKSGLNAVAAVEAIIEALDNQPQDAALPEGVSTRRALFITGHRPVGDAPPALDVHHVYLSTTTLLQF